MCKLRVVFDSWCFNMKEQQLFISWLSPQNCGLSIHLLHFLRIVSKLKYNYLPFFVV